MRTLAPGRASLSQAPRFGNLIFVQGCTGRHPTTGEVGKDIKEQARFAPERLKLIPEAAGASPEDVPTIIVTLLDKRARQDLTRCTSNISGKTGRPAPR